MFQNGIFFNEDSRKYIKYTFLILISVAGAGWS